MFGVEGLGCEVCERWVEKLDLGCYMIMGTESGQRPSKKFLARLFLNRPIRISRAQNAQRHWFDGTREGCPFQSSNELGGTRGPSLLTQLIHIVVAIGAQRRVQSRHTVTLSHRAWNAITSKSSPYQCHPRI